MKKFLIFILSLFLLSTSSIVCAQDKNDWNCGCEYTICSTVSKNARLKESFIVIIDMDKNDNEFAHIQTLYEDDKKALIVPNIEGGINILQITGSGGIATTTIDLQGNSVHSRNIIYNGELIPSQYYGKCICVPKK